MIAGDIVVNHQPIGGWTAQRVITHEDGEHVYAWRVTIAGVARAGRIRHNEKDGAAMLGSLILAEYAWQTTRGRRPGRD